MGPTARGANASSSKAPTQPAEQTMRRWKKRASLAFAGLALLLILAPGRADDRARPVDVAVLDQVWSLVRANFVNRDFNGIDWRALRQSYRLKAGQAKTRSELYALIQEMLAPLKASHLALIEEDVFQEHYDSEIRNRKTRTFGADLVLLPQGIFIAAVADGGPAAKQGLERGDRILLIDDEDPRTSGALRPAGDDPGLSGPPGFFLRAADPLKLTIERRPKAGAKGVFTRLIHPGDWNLVAASITSMRVVERRETKIATVHLWHLAHPSIVDNLAAAMHTRFRDCQGLVLDLRGRGGTAEIVDEVLALFDMRTRDGPRWNRPTVAIIDGGTRSAKEVLAFKLRERGITLVGQRSQGAVLGARFFKLRDGARLMIPVTDMRALTRGISLEGRGIAPDITVEDELPWCENRDPAYARALEEVYWKSQARKHPHHKRGWY